MGHNERMTSHYSTIRDDEIAAVGNRMQNGIGDKVVLSAVPSEIEKENALIADFANRAHSKIKPRAGNEIRPPCCNFQTVGWVNSSGDNEQSVGQRR